VHKSIKVRLSKKEYFMRYFVFYVKILQLSSLITRKILNKKYFIISVLESSRDELQECVKIYRVFHLKKLMRPSRDLQMTFQGQTNGIIL